MSETRPASGASNPIPRFAKSDDGTSHEGAARAEKNRKRLRPLGDDRELELLAEEGRQFAGRRLYQRS